MRRTGLAAGAVVVLTAAGCSSAPSGLADGPLAATPPSSGPSTQAPVSTFASMRCTDPDRALVRRVLDVVAIGGSAITSTLVPAVTTATGDWYVVGVDQAQQVGDGTVFPDRRVRALAVTDADPGHAIVIRLGNANGPLRRISWRRVSWTGDTLARGKRAVATAVACLDAT